MPSFVYGDTTTAADHGLASLGNKSFTHRPMVDGSPKHFDVDLVEDLGLGHNDAQLAHDAHRRPGQGRQAATTRSTSPTRRTWTSETAVAGKFMWEFTDTRMGYTYGEPVVAKTTKYGWVVALPSGVNNSDGKGYLFLVNPRTGALLEAIATPKARTTAPINMSQINGFVPSYRDFTLDTIYGTDLRGNVWRYDLTAASGPIRHRPRSPSLRTRAVRRSRSRCARPSRSTRQSGKRYVVVGTGKLLADSDITSARRRASTRSSTAPRARGGFYTTEHVACGLLDIPGQACQPRTPTPTRWPGHRQPPAR